MFYVILAALFLQYSLLQQSPATIKSIQPCIDRQPETGSDMDQHGSFVSAAIFVLLLLVAFVSSPVKAQEVDDEREFDYTKGSEKGPEHWGEIKEEWGACKNGEMQSPIDLLSERVKVMPKSTVDIRKGYRPTNATLKNRGHDIMLQWDANKAGSIKINGTDYYLHQAHWHSPSEHLVNGRRYDLELHMVHVSPDPNVKNKIVVVGLLYKGGLRRNTFLSKLTRKLSKIIDKEEERKMGIINPKSIKMKGYKYLRYMGSLTTPPCTQGVTWFINKKISTASWGQINLLRDAVHDYAEKNARPVQKLNGRDIHLYHFNH
ncbi:hypothetical protein MLD38_020363 [Melastoma candidum]|uniref:Uncharacterized protein n=1 Tax=Melastoma candidum TaxID=119954 RepID=A0ACB9QCP4_9MYRT|nr:hypothetical protein MLD38_020363 [Melastoma candidum]